MLRMFKNTATWSFFLFSMIKSTTKTVTQSKISVWSLLPIFFLQINDEYETYGDHVYKLRSSILNRTDQNASWWVFFTENDCFDKQSVSQYGEYGESFDKKVSSTQIAALEVLLWFFWDHA